MATTQDLLCLQPSRARTKAGLGNSTWRNWSSNHVLSNMKGKVKFVVGVLVILLAGGVPKADADATALSTNYYATSCPLGYATISALVSTAVLLNRGLAPQLLRMHFHDCFVRGCDASVLIYKSNHTAEMDGIPNKDSLKGFDFLTTAKAALEIVCPRTFSCADLVAVAARESVQALAVLQGQLLVKYWDVQLGRKDGNYSFATEANSDLPPPFFNYDQLKALFESKGLNETQMVTLSGAHTIGTANCTVSNNRLYNFTGQGDTDPSLNASYVPYLKQECPQGTKVVRIAMKDQTGNPLSTNFTWDNVYYQNVLNHKGLFTSDAALITNPTGFNLVSNFASNPQTALAAFNAAMVAMGQIGVSTQGHVHTNCSDYSS